MFSSCIPILQEDSLLEYASELEYLQEIIWLVCIGEKNNFGIKWIERLKQSLYYSTVSEEW